MQNAYPVVEIGHTPFGSPPPWRRKSNFHYGAYLIGIKGAGMAGLAQILQARGYKVTGSDVKDKFFTDKILRKAGIKYKKEGFSVRNLPLSPDTWFVASNAYLTPPISNPEIKELLKRSIPISSYSQAVAKIFNKSFGIAVCGTHGKTTTAALIAFILEKAGKNPTALIGGNVLNWNSNVRIGAHKFFVLEADEYQEQFLQYTPNVIVITNTDYDHPDYFKNRKAYLQAFEKFKKNLKKNGKVFTGNEEKTNIPLRIIGEHNAKNAMLAKKTALYLGIPEDVINKALGEFKGLNRRLETIGMNRGNILIDDYAHNPQKITASLDALRQKYLYKKITVIFQPHTFSRTEKFLKEFAKALSKADNLYLLDIFGSAREKKGRVGTDDLLKKIRKLGKKATNLKTIAKAINFFAKYRNRNEIIAAMGAGDVNKVVFALKKLSASPRQGGTSRRTKIAILGFGDEGKSIFRYLPKQENEIWILDRNKNLNPPVPAKAGPAGGPKIKYRLGKNYLSSLEDFDIIYRSPGVPYNLPQIQKAVKKGVAFSSATDVFFQEAKGTIIGITGTKGKGTTSTLLYKILKACNKDVYLAGNIGKPAIEILPKLKQNSISILELSSFQLQDLKHSPHMAVILDVFPDHQDSHKTIKEYLDAKAQIGARQKPDNLIFFFNDNLWSKKTAAKSKARKIPVDYKARNFLSAKDVSLPGVHNLKNSVMAATVAREFGCSLEKIRKTIKAFKGNEYRLELVKEIEGIKFYNDSASTNPHTAAAAVKSFTEPKILIAGGKDKGLDYKPLAQALKNSPAGRQTKLIILFGENRHKIEKQLGGRVEGLGTKIKLVKNMGAAVELAYKKAKSLLSDCSLFKTSASPQSSIIILFSPAAASFDMFANYKERGKKFKELVENLK